MRHPSFGFFRSNLSPSHSCATLRSATSIRPLTLQQMQTAAGGCTQCAELNPPLSTDAYARSAHVPVLANPELRIDQYMVPAMLS